METLYPEEPKTVAELLTRYRDVKRRLYPSPRPLPPRAFGAGDAENVLAFILASTAVAVDRARDAAEHAQRCADRARNSAERTKSSRKITAAPSSDAAAKAVLRSVSRRTGVAVDAILGRERTASIAAARHEAICEVHRLTQWSLPRLGAFFSGRHHSTILNSIRRTDPGRAEGQRRRPPPRHDAQKGVQALTP